MNPLLKTWQGFLIITRKNKVFHHEAQISFFQLHLTILIPLITMWFQKLLFQWFRPKMWFFRPLHIHHHLLVNLRSWFNCQLEISFPEIQSKNILPWPPPFFVPPCPGACLLVRLIVECPSPPLDWKIIFVFLSSEAPAPSTVHVFKYN